MKRNILYLLSIGICLFTCVGSHAAAPETRAHLERGRSLFDHGRWTDARYELLKAREGADRDDRLTLQQIDYQLAVCALKLGSWDAEAMLADFSKRYPESVYNNDLRFAQGLLYCSRSEYDKALACFGRVNYRALTEPGASSTTCAWDISNSAGMTMTGDDLFRPDQSPKRILRSRSLL